MLELNPSIDTSKIAMDPQDTDIVMVQGTSRHHEAMITNAANAKKYYSRSIIVNDKIYGVRAIKESGRTFLYLGGKYPNQSLTVSINSTVIKLPVNKLVNYKISVSGKIIGDKKQPYIFVRNGDINLQPEIKTIFIENNFRAAN